MDTLDADNAFHAALLDIAIVNCRIVSQLLYQPYKRGAPLPGTSAAAHSNNTTASKTRSPQDDDMNLLSAIEADVPKRKSSGKLLVEGYGRNFGCRQR